MSGKRVISTNKKAYHEYFVEETLEAGIELAGTEVKALRQGSVNLKDCYCRIIDGEIYVLGMHISPYEKGNICLLYTSRANGPAPAGPVKKLDRRTRKGLMLRLGGYILQYWPLFLLAVLLTLASNQLSLMGPKYSGDAIDAIAAESGVNFDARCV